MHNKINHCLAVLDVEGIIIPKRSYLLLQVMKRGFRKVIVSIFAGFLYEVGLITLEKAMSNIYRLFRGVSLDEFSKIFKTAPIKPGALDLLERLKSNGYQIVLISSGLPDFLVEEIARRLGLIAPMVSKWK